MTLDPSVRVHRLAQAVQVAYLLAARVEQLLDELDRLDRAQSLPYAARLEERDRSLMVRGNVRRQVDAYRSVRP